MVTAGALAHAASWTHRVSTSGSRIEVRFADGRRLDSQQIAGTLNRLGSVWNAGTASAVEADRAYAAQEFYAFCVSWLKSLPGVVVNRPAYLGVGGRWRHPSEWAMLAAEAGLQIRPYRLPGQGWSTSSLQPRSSAGGRTVIVLNDAVFGLASDNPLAQSCGRLARLADADLLGVDLIPDRDGTWRFADATPCPDLRIGGAPLLDSLSAMLGEEAALR